MSDINNQSPASVPDSEKNDEEKKKRVYKEFAHEKDGPTSLYLCLLGSGVIDIYFQRLLSI
jgi:hypothetical protein